MTTAQQTHRAFHATGRRLGAHVDAVTGLDLRPALFSQYHDLTTLRYDFPLVLVDEGSEAAFVRSLSDLMDDVIAAIAQDENASRITRDVLRVEQQIRALSSSGQKGDFLTLWDMAADRLGVKTDARLRESLGRARVGLAISGEVIDCDRDLPRRLCEWVWRRHQADKAARFRARSARLVGQLRELLRGDFSRSEAGRSAKYLRGAFGAARDDVFDFDVLSRTLATAAPATTLPAARRRQIEAHLAVLESDRLHPDHGRPGDAFIFESTESALCAYRDRLPGLVELARSLAVAHLIVTGAYDESTHGALFGEFDADDLALFSGDDVALFPDYLVQLDVSTMGPAEPAAVMKALSDGLPLKVLVQTDSPSAPLSGMAMGVTNAFVLQAPSSHLYQLRNQIARGLGYEGPALFSVFSGAAPEVAAVPPYLVSAAALESRAFPAFTYDPSAGADWAARFDLSANPQADRDWPLHRFEYADREHQRVSVDVAFTFADFAACDRRYARHLAVVRQAAGSEDSSSVSDHLARDPAHGSTAVPFLLMVDRQNRLQRVLADQAIIRETRLCRDRWHSLQELGGIHNSHAARLAARTPSIGGPEPPTAGSAAESPVAPAPIAAPSAPAAGDTAASPDDAYIETPRCSTCNECVQINNRMFAYNENRQAYIADASAGTYRQLVEAAESCQVSIIHPGKPRDAAEAGLDDLLQRAQPFL